MTSTAWVTGELDAVRAAGRWRRTRPFDAHGPAGDLDGAAMVSFASNDYLGLSTHSTVVAAAHDAIDRWGTGATASRLVVGSRPVHHDLEDALAAWKGTEAAALFPTGYAANLGVLTTLGGPDCLVVSDELNHASIIDGCRLSCSPVAIARHNDVDHVDALLAARDTDRAMVVVDAVFSMDGDEAPVSELASVCAARGAALIVDEAHAVLGPTIDPGSHPDVLIVRVVTLSKALGSMGGAVCAPGVVVDLLVNRARTFIFSTGLSPADTAAGLAAVDVVTGPEGVALMDRLRCVVGRVAPGRPSPIIPVLIGAEDDAMAASASLAERGLLIPAIRPPTVPDGTARLRIALSAAHDNTMIDRLLDGLAADGLRP